MLFPGLAVDRRNLMSQAETSTENLSSRRKECLGLCCLNRVIVRRRRQLLPNLSRGATGPVVNASTITSPNKTQAHNKRRSQSPFLGTT